MSKEKHPRYKVRLAGYSQLPKRDRLIVEARFCTKVESLLGSVDAVIDGYKAYCMNGGRENDEVISLSDWTSSVQTARVAALRGIPIQETCYFEISVDEPADSTDVEPLSRRARRHLP
jgi:hypothetical protein